MSRQIEIHDGTHESGAVYRALRTPEWADGWMGAGVEGLEPARAEVIRQEHAADWSRIDAAEERFYQAPPERRAAAYDEVGEPPEWEALPDWYEALAAAAEAARD